MSKKNNWLGRATIGKNKSISVSGNTKTETQEKLLSAVKEKTSTKKRPTSRQR